MKKEKLHSIVMKSESNEIEILSLKDRFTPVELATQLEQLACLDIITVIWDKGLIIKKGNDKDIITAKNNLEKKERSIPDYMTADKAEINKPYIKNERED